MGTATLTIDLDAIAANWRALDAMSGAGTETAAVIKADAYGLDAGRVGPALAKAGVRTFFVAVAEEGATLRRTLGDGPRVFVFSGHMEGDAGLIADNALIPLLNSPQQVTRHRAALPDHAFGFQLDTGLNRLGIEPVEWADLKATLHDAAPALVMSHLACSDEPDHEMNRQQLAAFVEMTHGIDAPRSLAATGGTILGAAYHFDLTRPGVGLYGGLPFTDAAPVVRVSAPVIQTRIVQPGETVGYANSWTARRKTHLATISAGYADGLIRAMGPRAHVFAGATGCKVVGRVSMDLITVDVSDLSEVPDALDIICPAQGVDDVAEAAGTIGYEILTSLGARYDRRYLGGAE